ncbi:MAG: D-glycerate dehydrogenase [Acidobacteriota bacterium]
MRKKVILTKRFGEKEVEILRDKYDLIVIEDEKSDFKEIIDDNKDAEALIPFLSDTIGKEIIDSMKNLKIIANYAVGYNNIDFKYAGEKGIFVTNTPDILTDATADLTLALILGVSRRIVESDKYMKGGRFKGWGANLLLGRELKGLTIGIIGLGKIGLATAIRAKAFGMNIVYNSRTVNNDAEKEYGFEYKNLEELIRISDIISLHLPYSPDVHRMFNSKTFGMMKKGSIFINVARGGLMDEDALADVLESGHLFGAGLDVFENEPAVNQRLTKMDNVIMTPHTGSATNSARSGMGQMVITNIEKALSGSMPVNIIPELKNMIKY